MSQQGPIERASPSLFPTLDGNVHVTGSRGRRLPFTAGLMSFQLMSAFGGKADIGWRRFNVRL
jgi:hypothetical protein